jgi:hypothetical protein
MTPARLVVHAIVLVVATASCSSHPIPAALQESYCKDVATWNDLILLHFGRTNDELKGQLDGLISSFRSDSASISSSGAPAVASAVDAVVDKVARYKASIGTNDAGVLFVGEQQVLTSIEAVPIRCTEGTTPSTSEP